MALTAQQLRDAAARLVGEDAQQTLGRTVLTKTNLTDAVAAVDAWCTANQASFLGALPEPFKSNSSAQQKAAMLAIVALARVT